MKGDVKPKKETGHSRSNPFPVRVGGRQGCHLSLVLFIILITRISRSSQVAEGVKFDALQIPPLLSADDVVLLPSSKRSLKLTLGWFPAEIG